MGSQLLFGFSMRLTLVLVCTTLGIVARANPQWTTPDKDGKNEETVARTCQSPRLKAECEAGKLVVATLVDQNSEGCEFACKDAKACLTYFQTKEMDCVLLKVKGKSTKEVGLPGPPYVLKAKPKPAAKGRSRHAKQVTWEDCVEFHFGDTCQSRGNYPYVVDGNNFEEALCIDDCTSPSTNEENKPGSKKMDCKSVITSVKGSESNQCIKTGSDTLYEAYTALCGVNRGRVIKGAGHREDLEGCIAENKAKFCRRGDCDLERNLVKIYTPNQIITLTEMGCMHACWSHGSAISGQCTHYQWIRESKLCTFYKEKDTTTSKDTEYKCEKYALETNFETFTRADLQACKSGGRKYSKLIAACGEMCNATLGQEARIEYPLAMAIDTSASQGDDRVKLLELINQLNATKAMSYQLLEYAKNETKMFDLRTKYADFKADLESLIFNGTNTYAFFRQGLKPLCEKAASTAFIIATIDEHTDNLDLEGEIAKCLVDKKATLFIALNPAFSNYTDSMEAYTRLAEGSGGKVVNIANDVAQLVTAIDTAMDNFCGCSLNHIKAWPQ